MGYYQQISLQEHNLEETRWGPTGKALLFAYGNLQKLQKTKESMQAVALGLHKKNDSLLSSTPDS